MGTITLWFDESKFGLRFVDDRQKAVDQMRPPLAVAGQHPVQAARRVSSAPQFIIATNKSARLSVRTSF
jgi:hypothetical protein